MEYQDFVCAIESRMNMRLEGGAKASLYTAVKNNGKEKQGVMITLPGVNVFPTIYLEEFYERFKGGEPLEEVVQELMDFYEIVKCKEPCEFSEIENFEDIRDKIVFKVIHTKKNKSLLRETPHVNFLDLSLVFYVLLEMKTDYQGMAAMLIRNEHLDHWKKGREELLSVAQKNGERLLPARLFTMEQAVNGMMSPVFEEGENLLDAEGENRDDIMYVLTNSQSYFGAACMAYPGVLKKVGDILGGDYYILPSSVHEVVLVPKAKAMEQYMMNEIVREINTTQVAEEDVLSDHVYFYEAGEGKLMMHQYMDTQTV